MHDYVIILASAPIVYVQCGFNECYKMPLEPPHSIFNNNNIYIYILWWRFCYLLVPEGVGSHKNTRYQKVCV